MKFHYNYSTKYSGKGRNVACFKKEELGIVISELEKNLFRYQMQRLIENIARYTKSSGWQGLCSYYISTEIGMFILATEGRYKDDIIFSALNKVRGGKNEWRKTYNNKYKNG